MTSHEHNCRNPLQCILPPYILSGIVNNGTNKQKQRALLSLKSSGRFRGEREALIDITPRRRGTTASASKRRKVYDGETTTQLPGRLVRSEGDPATGDAAVDEAYDGAGDTFDLYADVFGRNSIDGQGLELISTVHHRMGFDNAFWDGNQMAYGDGDEDLPVSERLFNRFTISLEIIGHELTHGVTQYEANLVYRNQPGALNESMSDVFGALVKQYKLKQTAEEADWLVGTGLFTDNIDAQGIRSMAAPGTAYDDRRLGGKDPQPAHMDNIYTGFNDNGGVHINSGIPNHAFYVTAMEIGGHAWEKAGRIWYRALTEKLSPSTKFCEAARIIFTLAGEMYGVGSTEQLAVRKGWETVGIDVTQPCPDGRPMPPTGCLVAPVTIMGSYLGFRGGDIF